MQFDLLITGGQLYDGTGGGPVTADLGIIGRDLVALGDLSGSEAARRLDASGLAICPGFVDLHSHSDLTLLANPRAESKLHQGVTTELVGHCGLSPHPVQPGARAELAQLCSFLAAPVEWSWETTAEYLATLRQARPSVNVGALVGHSAIRALILDFADEPACGQEIEQMEGELQAGFDQGALGMSLGLAYPLGRFAELPELESLATLVAKNDRLLTVHLRSEGPLVLESVQEMVEIARTASDRAGQALKLQINHLKCSGRQAWGMMPKLLQALEQARAEGLDLAFDVYPYTAGSRHLIGSFPGWLQSGGPQETLRRLQMPEVRQRLAQEQAEYERAERPDGPLGAFPEELLVVQVATEESQWAVGKRLTEIAEQTGADPMEAALDLLVAEQGQVNVVTFTISEDDLRLALTHPLGMVATDGLAVAPYGPLSRGKPHPRCYGTYPRLLGHYVREEKLLSLAEAIRRSTSAPAARLGLTDRGLLREGYRADLVIFDPATLADRATYTDPHHYPDGIAHVIVNGQIAVDHNEHTGASAGKILMPE